MLYRAKNGKHYLYKETPQEYKFRKQIESIDRSPVGACFGCLILIILLSAIF